MAPVAAARVLLLAVLCGAAASARAGPVELPADLEHVALGTVASYLLDEAGALGPEEALAAARRGGFAPLGRPLRSFGPTGAAVWVHVALRAGAAGPVAITFDQPLVEHLDAFVVSAAGMERKRGGLAVPRVERTIHAEGPYHRFELALAAGERVELLWRVRSRRSVVIELGAWSNRALGQRDLLAAAAQGVDAGMVALALLASLYGYFAMRDRWSLRLAGVMAAFGAYQAAVSGVGSTWLWPDRPDWAMAAAPVFASAMGAFAISYARAFVSSAAEHPRLDQVARWCWAAALAGIPLAAARPDWAFAVAGLGALATFPVVVALAVAAVRRGDRPSRFFLAAWVVVAVMGFAFVGAFVGVLPASPLTLHGLTVAVWGGTAVLFIGQVDRLEVDRDRARSRLEREVAERTHHLREAVDRLQVEVLERERAERDLRESEERFRLAFATSPDAVNINRLSDGVYVAVNEGFTRLTGWTEADVLGRSSLELQIWADPADRERLVAGLRAEGRVQNLEARFRFKDGRVMTGLMSAQVMQLRGVPHILSVTRDVSDWKRAEAERDRLAGELRQSQKMEAIGRLAGGVAHDFNNLLTAISANASLTLMDLPGDAPARAGLEEILDASRRAAQLTRQLLAFSRRQVIAPRPIDLGAQVASLRTLLERLLGEDVELQLELAGGLPPVLADPGQVEQVVVNLALNARDAMPGGGRIVISTAAAEVPEGAPGGRPPGRYGVVAVRDEGAGMTPEVLEHVFEPFFTTKGGKGTGLGLSTVYGIAAQHGGFVEVESAPGRGSTFRVHLQLAAGPARAEAAPLPIDAAFPGGQETVLLAEDDAAVRAATRTFLERCGYRVVEASDGAEAERLCARADPAVDLLLTDVIMPRMNGRELAERLRAARPGLGVVFMSGYTQDVIDRAGRLGEGMVLVQKPFEPAQLAAALRQALERRPGAGRR